MKFLLPLAAAWRGLSSREKNASTLAAAVVLGALVWWIALAPALGTLRSASQEHRRLDAQLARMQTLAQQAASLKGQPRLSFQERLPLLEATLKQQLGASASWTVAGERVTVTLQGGTAEALAQTLVQARLNAHALPSLARLVRNANRTWDGTLTFDLRTR